jgi:hypothetical protein
MAMTATERSHRYRAKHAATKPATKQSEADAGALAAEIAWFKAVGAEKDREIDRLRKELVQARAAAKVSGEIDPATLSMSAQERLEAAIRQREKTLDAQFAERVRQEVLSRVTKFRDEYDKRINEAEEILHRRKGVIDLDQYNLIRACLHPDNSASESKRNQAFTIWTELRRKVLAEKDEPTPKMHRATVEEMMAMKRKVQEERSAAARARMQKRARGM